MKSSNVNTDKIGSTSKVERYGWRDLTTPGELMWIDKHALSIDHRYQREGDNERAQRLASQFSWQAFGVLIVARRADGSLLIPEGQHRWLASLKRADVTKVPCIVFDSVDIADEAEVFLEANANRKPVSAIAKFKALVLTGDPVALEVKKLIESVGRSESASPSANTVSCVAIMQRLANRSGETLTRVWPLIASVCRGAHITERIVDALVYLEQHMPNSESLLDRRWKTRLQEIGIEELNMAMSKAAAFYARGGAKVWATGIVQRLNKGVAESKRLRLPDASVP